MRARGSEMSDFTNGTLHQTVVGRTRRVNQPTNMNHLEKQLIVNQRPNRYNIEQTRTIKYNLLGGIKTRSNRRKPVVMIIVDCSKHG